MNTPLLVAKTPGLVRTERCDTCKWASAPDPRSLECRRNPPTAHIVPGPNGQAQAVSCFPPTQPDHWCGCYTIKITVQ